MPEREYGHRFADGSARPEASRDAALATVARFKPGFVEIVYRDSPDGPWKRDDVQPHTLEERFDAIFDFLRERDELSLWRGTKLTELGLSPNPWSWGEPEHVLLFQEKVIKDLRRRVAELKGSTS